MLPFRTGIFCKHPLHLLVLTKKATCRFLLWKTDYFGLVMDMLVCCPNSINIIKFQFLFLLLS